MKKYIALAVGIIFLLGCMVVGYDVKVCHAKSMLLSDANNTVCPVTGKAITDRKYSTGYKGKRYWFASYNAIQTFKKNPDNYMGNVSTASGDSSRASKKRSW